MVRACRVADVISRRLKTRFAGDGNTVPSVTGSPKTDLDPRPGLHKYVRPLSQPALIRRLVTSAESVRSNVRPSLRSSGSQLREFRVTAHGPSRRSDVRGNNRLQPRTVAIACGGRRRRSHFHLRLLHSLHSPRSRQTVDNEVAPRTACPSNVQKTT